MIDSCIDQVLCWNYFKSKQQIFGFSLRIKYIILLSWLQKFYLTNKSMYVLCSSFFVCVVYAFLIHFSCNISDSSSYFEILLYWKWICLCCCQNKILGKQQQSTPVYWPVEIKIIAFCIAFLFRKSIATAKSSFVADSSCERVHYANSKLCQRLIWSGCMGAPRAS